MSDRIFFRTNHSEPSFFLRFFLFTFRERGREGERDGEKYQCVVASPVSLSGELAYNPACALTETSSLKTICHCSVDSLVDFLGGAGLAVRYGLG